MRLRHLPRVLVLPLLAALAAAPVRGATIVVNDAGDAISVDGKVTLREALTSIMNGSNVNGDVSASGTYGTSDAIHFAIGTGFQGIIPGSALPTITKPVTIDGTTQPGFSGSPLIQLQGTSAGAGVDGLTLSNHTGSVIRGLIVVSFDGNGIVITGSGGGHVVAGNWIGVTTIGGAGNAKDGIKIVGVPNNRIGGTTAADRNVIADNGNGPTNFAGVEINGAGATGNLVEGNYIGLDPTGTVALGNSKTFGWGLTVGPGSGNTIGGTAAGAGNVISDNGGGVEISSVTSATFQGNLVGTDATGTIARGNHGDGVVVNGTAGGVLIGGTTAAARNVISGNTGNGVVLGGCQGSSSGNQVEGNFIGVDVSQSAMGNGGDGVRVDADQHDATISGNTIALNTGNGVGVKPDPSEFCGPQAHGITISGNRIHHNALLGIDLGLDGVTANDALDADTGVNGFQNFPVLTSADSNGVSIAVAGTFDGAPNATFRLEFFTVPTCDASGNGEGQNYLGFTTVNTSGSGHAAFSATFPAPAAVNTAATATATDAAGDTSEFSACEAISAVPDNPPTAADDSFATPFQTALVVAAPGVLGNDSDPDGDAITAVPDVGPAHGNLTLNPDGSFTYTPNAGFTGTDTFTYHATDGQLSSSVATVTVGVGAAPSAGIPTLSGAGLLVLALTLAGAALLALRR